MPTAPSPALPLPSPAILANQHIYSDYFDEEYVRAVDRHILQLLDRVWFRSKLVGFEPYPQRNNPERPLLFASNHSGMAFPWDAMVALSHLLRVLPSLHDLPRPLSAPMLSQSVLMNPYLIPHFWKKCGCVDATTLNFETMMYCNGHNLMLYPEGVPGIGKGFNRKYQLQRLATSIIRLGIEHHTDIMPYYTVNGEYLNPYAYSWDWLNKWTKKIGIPFIPVGPIILMVLLQPWFFYLAYPANLTFVLGTRIKPYELTEKPASELTRDDYVALSEQVRQQMQTELDAAVRDHGQYPYRWGELWQRIKANWSYFPFFLPFAWPELFREFERQYDKGGPEGVNLQLTKPGSWLRMIWRNPFTLTFFIPVLGWIPIAIRGYKGHRIGKKA
ncbi:hypothetical protein SAMN00120144_3495 [Hymenobacter roseosalivarius DSM 11622]|uniref:Phospholipid/glycerol acyltransferase domain-containing protein n=1 Tax=Hymenobacter roseosalivarius DSM 11622 TaxID=645990 RepID=A0A1W1VXR1_9BACT|nr:hypothetical protein [Hymenobacter roseosalivarius]SMB98126.1 hypothetical protein SAMN00120144_3495 [Hymenobacter roseosalivarius DSM 11622]